MNMEGPKLDKQSLPKKNTLPLRIKDSEEHARGGDSTVWKTEVQDKEGLDKLIALKQVRQEVFASGDEMQKSKQFYEFLKNFPGFGKFVPDTLYFKARVTADSNPQAFCIQSFIGGERIDRIKDDELYKDPEVVRQLLEFIDAATQMLQTVRENKMPMPDLMRAPESSSVRVMLGGLATHPRYSSNIFLSDKPDENGQRIFFVDTGMNADVRTKKAWELYTRHVVGPIQELQLKNWKKKLEAVVKV